MKFADDRCQYCGLWFENDPIGRKRNYCSDACKQKAYRQRRAEKEIAALSHITSQNRDRVTKLLSKMSDRRNKSQ